MAITTTIPTTLDFPNRGVLERDAFVLAQETAQDLLAGAYTTALNQYATELNTTQTEINIKAEQVANQAVAGGYSQAYIDATFTPKILNTQANKATPVDTDLIPLSDSASSFGLKKLSWLNIKNTIISSFGGLINGLTAKATPIDADMIIVADSASSNASKKLTFANLKAMIFTNTALTGTPTAPTPTAGDNSTKVATTAFINSEVGTSNSSLVKIALSATGTAPIYACRAWVNFNGTGTVAIRASGNVSSITDNNTGDYTINFTTAMPNENYSSPSSISYDGGSWHNLFLYSKTASALRVKTPIFGGGFADESLIDISIFR